MRRVLVLLIVLALATALCAAARAETEIGQALAQQRALQIYGLMQRYFYVASSGGYLGTYPPKGAGHAQAWPYSQALAASLQLARLPGGGSAARAGLSSAIAGLAPYRAALPGELAYAPLYGGKGNVFYDDNVWIGLELVDASGLLHDPAALVAAERVFAWITTGWDARARACPGGIYWLMPGGSYWNHSARNRYRTAVSTLNAALLGVVLYEHTGTRADLRFAERAYAWSRRCLPAPGGLVADHIDAAGKVTMAVHSYNQGAFIATAVELYRVTHERSYLQAALRTTRSALAVFRNALGTGEPASFIAIFYTDLLHLMPIADRGAIRADLAAFAARAWLRERNPATGLFAFGHTYATLLDQSAMVQIFAELAGTA